MTDDFSVRASSGQRLRPAAVRGPTTAPPGPETPNSLARRTGMDWSSRPSHPLPPRAALGEWGKTPDKRGGGKREGGLRRTGLARELGARG